MPPLTRRTLLTRRALTAALALAAGARIAPARGAATIRIGQATTSLSFLPLWAARAFDTFSLQNLSLDWAAIPGGDPAALAALDSADLDLAAVGGDTLLTAIAKGQPFQVVATLMDRVSLDLVVSKPLLERAKVAPGDPLAKRLAALQGALVGVSAVGGAQDRAVRWLAARGGIDPKSVQVALVGGPPALQAALANDRIEAFILSPPEAQIAEAGGYGHKLIGMADDFPQLQSVPFLVLAAKTPVPDAARIVATLKALAVADDAVTADPAKAAAAIQAKFFPKIDQAIIRSGVDALRLGIVGRGAVDAGGIEAMIRFANESGVPVAGIRPAQVWTRTYIDAALR